MMRNENENHKDSEESEESEEEDPHAFVLTPDGVSKYIVRGYTDNMAGKDIPDKWVVKSYNRRLFWEDESVLLLGEKYGSMSHVWGVLLVFWQWTDKHALPDVQT
jgi:hypothetical protein